jgi:uncharacterized membrane protein required for colicin V production
MSNSLLGSITIVIVLFIISYFILDTMIQTFKWAIDRTLQSIFSLLVVVVIVEMLNSLGFAFCADIIEFLYSLPSEIVEIVKGV